MEDLLRIATATSRVRALAASVVETLPAAEQEDGTLVDPSTGNAVLDALVAREVAATLEALATERDSLQRQLGAAASRAKLLAQRDAGEATLPVPRLQLVWTSPTVCRYELVMPLTEHDIRREHDEVRGSRNLAVVLGVTTTSGGEREPIYKTKEGQTVVRTPYRDGVHVIWDAKHLKLPAYAMYGDHVTKLGDDERG